MAVSMIQTWFLVFKLLVFKFQASLAHPPQCVGFDAALNSPQILTSDASILSISFLNSLSSFDYQAPFDLKRS
ncbi:hypothetical protein B0H11DRAFT_1975206 [Mycena galericulata]|nr:hypothetical protein B0H11DRAFT_1975206 [Mycena galericulata]